MPLQELTMAVNRREHSDLSTQSSSLPDGQNEMTDEQVRWLITVHYHASCGSSESRLDLRALARIPQFSQNPFLEAVLRAIESAIRSPFAELRILRTEATQALTAANVKPPSNQRPETRTPPYLR